MLDRTSRVQDPRRRTRTVWRGGVSRPHAGCESLSAWPSLVVPSRAESFPYIVLEAAACAIPLIATDVGGISEIVPKRATGSVGGNGSELIPAGDPIALATAIAARLANPAQAAEMAQHLQTRARALFSVERMTDDVLSFYEAVLTNKQTARA